MTDIRELLREATADISAVHSDPVGQVRRASVRRRRSHAAVGLAVIAVAAAIVVPIGLSTSSKPHPPATHHQPEIRDQWPSNDGDVASGYGFIWGVKCCGNDPRPSFIERLDPASGTQITKIAVPGPAARIAVGAGRVWTYGASDAGISAIAAYDPLTTRVTSIRSRSFAPDTIAFSRGSAWVTMSGLNQVWRLTPTKHGFHKSVLTVPGQPRAIVATGDGALWVERDVKAIGSGRCSSCALTNIVATNTTAHLGKSVPWAGEIFVGAGPHQMWASTGDGHTLVLLQPSLLSGCSACAQSNTTVVKGQAISWIASTTHGLFVSTYGSPGTHNGVDYFSYDDLGTAQEGPTARLTVDAGPLATDGDGVVIAAEDPGLVHWVPAVDVPATTQTVSSRPTDALRSALLSKLGPSNIPGQPRVERLSFDGSYLSVQVGVNDHRTETARAFGAEQDVLDILNVVGALRAQFPGLRRIGVYLQFPIEYADGTTHESQAGAFQFKANVLTHLATLTRGDFGGIPGIP